jgi:ATP-dependent DNA helicase DinG
MDTATPRKLRLPAAPVLAADARGVVWISTDGEVTHPGRAEAAELVQGTRPMVCHAKATAARLNTVPFPAFDLLELFAFARPARFCLPTPRGLAAAVGLEAPGNLEDAALAMAGAAQALLAGLDPADSQAVRLAEALARGGDWPWAEYVLAALGGGGDKKRDLLDGFRVWARLKEWSEHAPEPPAGHFAVSVGEATARLAELLPADAEERTEQRAYCAAVAGAFAPTDKQGDPRVVIAEAGTGVGKTLGYIAPASVWAEKNHGPVWISTYTRNLQRQLDGELDKLYPDPVEKSLKAVVRKGRENYLCLLNLEDAVRGLATAPGRAAALAIVARWAAASRDGDMVGGDFPAWLVDMLGYGPTLGLTDTRGECIYAACSHYGKCFVERTVRRARRAEIVVANHALVMVQAALGGIDDAHLPTRYVFDEGHHLFDAADNAFSAQLSGAETAELRRWLVGAEGRRGLRSRARGLKARVDDLIAGDETAAQALTEILRAARMLPAEGWHARLADGNPAGAAEKFLLRARQQVYARDRDANSPYDLEAETHPPVPGLIEAADELAEQLEMLAAPVRTLMKALVTLLDAEANTLDTATRHRIEAIRRSLERRAIGQVQTWRAMLASLKSAPPEDFVDWFSVSRIDGRDIDVGLHRHWVDPTVPLAEQVIEPAHGALITSATLRDGTGDAALDWRAAEARTGGAHLATPPDEVAEASPFDYPAHTRVFVVTDIDKNDIAQLATAYRELFLASGGGAIGLFTSIARLRGVHKRLIADTKLDELDILAQHVDPLDTGTLIDIFRAEEDACLLGTDAVRDGIDVPGRSLRLIAFDRVPWPRPTILHKARREAADSKTRHDDMLTRLKLKQAFGRLVRRADDHGVFVLLDKAFPSRLAGAFPDGVEVQRLGLADVIAGTRAFLGQK